MGRSQGPALALAGLQVPCQQGGFGSQFLPVGSLGLGPPLFACATCSGKPSQKRPLWAKSSVPCTPPPSVSSSPSTRQWKAQAPWPQNSPYFPKCLWGFISSFGQDGPGPEGRTEGVWRLGPLCHGLWMENVQLFILCTQFVNVSFVLNKQAAFPRESCPFIPTAQSLAVDKRLSRRRWGGGESPAWSRLV